MMAPEVVIRVIMAFAKLVHLLVCCILLYLDYWLALTTSLEEMMRANAFVLNLVRMLGLFINCKMCGLSRERTVFYLGMSFDLNHFFFWVVSPHLNELRVPF